MKYKIGRVKGKKFLSFNEEIDLPPNAIPIKLEQEMSDIEVDADGKEWVHPVYAIYYLVPCK